MAPFPDCQKQLWEPEIPAPITAVAPLEAVRTGLPGTLCELALTPLSLQHLKIDSSSFLAFSSDLAREAETGCLVPAKQAADSFSPFLFLIT